MFLAICIILVILLILYIWATFKASSGKHGAYYYDEGLNDEDDYISPHKSSHHNDTFAYPDPYELSGDKAMFLDDEGEILDDL